MDHYMLSTIDNPYDYFDDFDNWYNYDLLKGHDCCGYLDRIARTSDQLTDEENAAEIERAIDEIIKYDFTNQYIKVKQKTNSEG